MMRTLSKQILTAVLLVGVLVVIGHTALAEGEPPIPPPAPELDRLRQLEGTWEGTAMHGDQGEPEPAKAVYHVTSAGSAIVETIFAGTENEMVTVYHMDGDKIVMTHYCALGNQPKMGAMASSDSNSLAFKFIEGSNMKSKNEPHMHAMTMKFIGKDHIQADWTMYADGQPGHTAHLDLHRR